jgi:purine-binding chemotaxis protein CheW
MEGAEYTQRTCIIVLQVESDNGSRQVGVIVDGVSEVLTIQEQEIENTPDFGDQMRLPYILGMAKVKGKVKILLDIDRVLSQQECDGLDRVMEWGRE